MAAQKKATTSINLLPQEEFSKSATGRILNWLLTSFRIIVIVTELVVMGAFISRFFLDARGNDLSDAINAKKAVITSLSKFEREFRLTQQKLAVLANLTSEQNRMVPYVETITATLPPDITLISFGHDVSGFSLKASTISEQSIAQFISNLKSTSRFSIISLTSVDVTESNPFITFSIRLKKVG